MSAAARSCETCRHFQRYRPLTQLIARDVGAMEPALASELTRMMQDERQKQDAEAEQRLELLRIERAEWPDRPTMSDYCALREGEGLFLLYEVKNAGGDCADHQPGQTERRACSTCASSAPGRGAAKQNEMLMRYRQLQNLASAAGEPSDHGLSSYLSAVGAQQSFEAAQAYYFGRFSVAPPDYLQICLHFSTEQEYVPCAVANRHDRCAVWRSPASSNAQPGLFVAAAFGKTPR
jgi:hypothetical protein